jgi:hypothetical protein
MTQDRLANIIKTKSISKLRNFFEHVSKGKEQPLTDAEVSTAFKYLQSNSANTEFEQLLWFISSYSPPDIMLMDLALRELDHAERLQDSVDTNRVLQGMLSYALHTAPPALQIELIDRFRKAVSVELCMVVAEHMINTGNTKTGLKTMVDLLPRVQMNHDISDSIAMWLGYYGDNSLRKELLEEASLAMKHMETERYKRLKWAASMIP